jgi:hypothetical protein
MENEYNTYRVNFSPPYPFELQYTKPLIGTVGLYFIFANKVEINYPFAQSRLLYIGMSELRTNSIGKRLEGHYIGKSGNIGILSYKKVDSLYFTYINILLFKNIWKHKIEDLENYFILDFVKSYGVYPICNNKSSNSIESRFVNDRLEIDWNFFCAKSDLNHTI